MVTTEDMRLVVRLSLAVLLACCAPLWFSAPARADTTVAALGVRSLDGESDLERRLSNALRNSAGTIADWTVGKREASLEQMTLALGCDEPDSRCMGEIAKTMAVDLLLYGTVVNTSGGYELTVYQYDASGHQVRSAAATGLKLPQLRAAPARESFATLLSRLNTVEPPPPPPLVGQLRVYGDMPGAQIAVDGETAGSLDEKGVLTLELSPGKHLVRAAGAAFAPAEEEQALVEAGQTSELVLQITPLPVAQPAPEESSPPVVTSEPAPAAPKRSLRRAFGWVSVGVGAAFAIATIYSWVRIEHINDDPDFLAYRQAFLKSTVPGGVGNVCPRAALGELAAREPNRAALERRANDLCNEADTLSSLQYVFLGGALVGGGVGTYLLLSARKKERSEQPSLSFAPRLGYQSAALEARLRF
jgi:hypothetical protein